MDDLRFGAAIRAVRRRRRLSQHQVAARAHVSQSTISRAERGHLDTLSLETIRKVGAALDVRVDLTPRWRGGDLDRLLNARHPEMHEQVARYFAREYPAWQLAPEVSFSVYGERGVIDLVAWHEPTRTLLVIELKTQIVDVNELAGTADRKRRLARDAVRDRGWEPKQVGLWLIVADGRTNRRRIAAHEAMLRAAFPADARAIRAWLANPSSLIAAMSVWPT